MSASEESGAEQVNERVSGPVLTFGFLILLDHSVSKNLMSELCKTRYHYYNHYHIMLHQHIVVSN